MNQQTINQLNQLNQRFYQITAEKFDQARKYFWEGWDQLLPMINSLSQERKTIKVLDLGCGNARFAEFLAQELGKDFEYTGVDANELLLSIAQEKLTQLKISHKLQHLDLIQALANNRLQQELKSKYDLVVLFGVMHHIPSFKFRNKLMGSLKKIMTQHGILVFTAWQFADKDRFADRIVDPNKAKLQPQQLEKNDYILDWRKGQNAYRYCHFMDEKEAADLADKQSSLKLIKQFYADGKSQDLNLYTLLQKTS